MPVQVTKDIKLASYGNIDIFVGFPYNVYNIKQPHFSTKEEQFARVLIKVIQRGSTIERITREFPDEDIKEFSKRFKLKIINLIEAHECVDKLPTPKAFDEIKAELEELISKIDFIKDKEKFAQYVLDYGIGFGQLAEAYTDNSLEEIMVNGVNRPVFVFHREHAMCKTNVQVEDQFILNLIRRIAKTEGKNFDENNPLLDSRLPDGSRGNATFSYVTPKGHTLTIRKFTTIPLSIVDLISNKTISSELAAFLWVMVEGLNIEPMNIIITGGASSGKTTLMGALSTFMRYRDRVISIEDTIELDLGGREDWVQMEARQKSKDTDEVTMNDLLQNALRMRPDRLIVGEVRGDEAQTLFVAMDTGHRGILGTLHSNSAREMLLRLKAAPMNVPEMMLPLVDIIVVMQKRAHPDKGVIRRIKHVAEVSRMEEKVLLSNIFELNKKTDKVERTDVPSHVIEVISERTDMSKSEVRRETLVRKKILEWMLANKIFSTPDVESLIQQYYLNPRIVLEKVSEDISPA